jgi:AraC-like DNA-binding protein
VVASKGDLITVSPGEVHDGASVDKQVRAWTMLYIAPSTVASFCVDEDRCGREENELEFSAAVVRDDWARARFADLDRLLRSAQPRNDLQLEEAVSRLIVPLVRLRSPGDRPTHLGVNRVIERLSDDVASTPTLSELAAIAGVSRFQLIRAVERATGLTPFALLKQNRLNEARRLIAAGLSIAEAAGAAGFSDQSHLTRSFKATYGVTPGALRDTNLRGHSSVPRQRVPVPPLISPVKRTV